jgi:hypothetical protein
MFQRARKHLNPATALAFVALIFAITGGAFAATGGHGGSGPARATPTASAAKASTKARVGPRGPAGARGATGATGAAGAVGPAGPTGATGAKGDTGAPGGNGSNGTNGAPGPAGETVYVKTLGPHEKGCDNGGAEFSNKTGEASACNGESGTGGSGGEGYPKLLPAGKSETGTFGAIIVEGTTTEPSPGVREGIAFSPISFTVALAVKPKAVHYITLAAQKEVPRTGTAGKACPGTAEEPTAEEGVLCVYEGGAEEPMGTSELTISGFESAEKTGRAGRTGTVAKVKYEGAALGGYDATLQGSWAVTGE